MVPRDPFPDDLSPEWRCALVGSAVGAALTLGYYLQTGQGGPLLLVCGVVAGYLAPADADAYAAGARAGLVGALPLLALFVLDSLGWFAALDSTAFAAVAAAIVVAFVLGVGYLVGGIGAGVGGWLAVQFGRKEPA